MNKKAVLILSGGQDSTTCLAWAKKAGMEVHAITFNYGQRHIREVEAARHVARIAGVAHEVIDLGGDLLKGTSPLTDPQQELEQYPSFEEMDRVIGNRIEKTFVPMRNALFLTIAANRMACLGARILITGVCEADNANYPDCREAFIQSQEETIHRALGGADLPTILAPLIVTDKEHSIYMMRDLGCLEWLAFTHTAYDGQYPPVGRDHATVLRAHGFEKAGLPDPLVLRAWAEGLMPLPSTVNYLDFALSFKMVEGIRKLALELGLSSDQAGREFA